VQQAVCQDGVVVDQGAAVVQARHIGRREHGHHTGLRLQGGQINAQQLAVGQGGQAQGCMQGAGQLRDVVRVGGLAADVQVCRFVGQALARG
jgi:hypothetical protein